MGSLMAGWNSPVLGDERKVRLMRNRSLTREEVDAFWRRQQQRKPPPEDQDATSTTSSPLTSPRAGNVSPLASPRAGDVSSPLASPGRAQQEMGSSRCQSRRLERMSSMPSPLARTVMTRSEDHPYQSYSHSEPPSPAAPHADNRHQPSFPDLQDDDVASTSSECWWTRSSWAFLNETPSPEQQMFGKAQTYACVQFHVSRVVTGNA